MIRIEPVDLTVRGVTLPSDRVGMVIAQPFMPSASLTAEEPYQCTEQTRPQQLAVLNETLAVARAAHHGEPKTHFTVFPEYSIPGLPGVDLVETALRAGNWPTGTIVIGGTDGLTQAQYVELLQGEASHYDAERNGGDKVGVDRWVNCAITWVKTGDGHLERWIQPKLHPAWEEINVSHQHMFCGSSVYVFKGLLGNGASFRFATLVCFDWIAKIGIQTPCQWLLAELQQEAGEGYLPLSWLFIIQRNKKPSHNTFLAGVTSFFDLNKFPKALPERACLVFVNTAGRISPGRAEEFGGCSLVLSPQSLFASANCAPTFSGGGPRFRDGNALPFGYKDIVFRERGACIHSFAQINPGSLTAGAAGRSLPVENAYVFPISGVIEPRAPAAAVPAPVKWFNDELDEIQSLSSTYGDAPLAPQADDWHQRNITTLRTISSQSATKAINLATGESRGKYADDWNDIESAALKHLVHTLDILGVGFPTLTLGAMPPHATAKIDNKEIDIFAICGPSHEDCIKYSKSLLSSLQHQFLVISRDPDNTLWLQRFGTFLAPQIPTLSQEPKFTDPGSASLHLGYQDLLGIFRRATIPAEIEGGIRAELAA